MTKKRKTKPQPIKTQRELSVLVERDESQISRWLQDDRWPFGSAPWSRSDLPKMLRWIAEDLRNKPDEADAGTAPLRREKLEQEIRRLKAQAETFELQLAKEKGASLDAAEVKARWANIGQVIRSGLQNLPPQVVSIALRHGMAHTASASVQSEVRAVVDDVLMVLSREGRDE